MLKSEEEIKEEIEKLRKQRKMFGETRVSCANLGRGITDHYLKQMERCDDKIETLQSLLKGD